MTAAIYENGKWTAVWPGGRSSGWKTEAQALAYAKSNAPKRSKKPLDLQPCKDA